MLKLKADILLSIVLMMMRMIMMTAKLQVCRLHGRGDQRNHDADARGADDGNTR